MRAIDGEKLAEWLRKQHANQDWPFQHRHAFLVVKRKIESGAFDVDSQKEETELQGMEWFPKKNGGNS